MLLKKQRHSEKQYISKWSARHNYLAGLYAIVQLYKQFDKLQWMH